MRGAVLLPAAARGLCGAGRGVEEEQGRGREGRETGMSILLFFAFFSLNKCPFFEAKLNRQEEEGGEVTGRGKGVGGR